MYIKQLLLINKLKLCQKNKMNFKENIRSQLKLYIKGVEFDPSFYLIWILLHVNFTVIKKRKYSE